MDGKGSPSFGDLLRHYRRAAGLTQEELAERSHLSLREISDLERGARRRPRRDTARLLADALDLEPTDLDRLDGAARRTSVTAAHPTGLPAYHNLPEQLTSFIGREVELAEWSRELASARLLTLVGTGGCGKTRLALQLAAEQLDRHPEGVWLVELASLADPALVPQSVAAAIAIREEPGKPLLATLRSALRTRHLLLVLDNCEHLLDACARLADLLLRGCPRVRIVATSREALGVAGEVVRRVPSLATPSPEQIPPVERLTQYEAVRLFVERANAMRPAFAVTIQNAPAVAEICWRLDGIPLAIELAAVRVESLTVEQIAARLDDRFRLLTGGGRAVLRRHQTLRALVDWSHDLLSDSERVIFRRLAVFAGGWTLEAAEQVCAGDGIEAGDVLNLLAGLVHKSLVVAEDLAGEERYRFLETMRQYAAERLGSADEMVALRDRHRDWSTQLARRAAAATFGPLGPDHMARFYRELDNLRAALSWCRESSPETGLALVADLAWYWVLSNIQSEGVVWLSAFLDAVPARSVTRARALLRLEHLLRVWEFDEVRARGLAQEALAIAREIGNDGLTSEALAHIGLNEANAGDYASARVHLEESLALARSQKMLAPVMNRLRDLGILGCVTGEYARGRSALHESIAVARAIGVAGGVGMALLRLGALERIAGDLDSARAWLEESLRQNREARHAGAIEITEASLADLARSEGRLDEARARLVDGLRHAGTHGSRSALLHRLCSLGILTVTNGDYARGTRLIATYATADGLVGTVHSPDLRVEGPDALARARAALGEDAFAAAWAEGRSMSLEQAVSYALGEDSDT